MTKVLHRPLMVLVMVAKDGLRGDFLARLQSVWLTVCKYGLGPILKFQGARVGRTVLRLPEAAGARSGMSGDDGATLRLLLVGDSTAAGVGVARQEIALAWQSAEAVSRRLGCGVSWTVVAQSGVTTAAARELVAGIELGPADVMILALGTNDVLQQRTRRQFVEDYRLLVEELSAKTGAKFAVVNGLPPLHLLPATPQPLRWYLGRCARRLDDALQRWAGQEGSREYVSLQWASNVAELAGDGFHPGEAQYRHWAEYVAEGVERLLERA